MCMKGETDETLVTLENLDISLSFTKKEGWLVSLYLKKILAFKTSSNWFAALVN